LQRLLNVKVFRAGSLFAAEALTVVSGWMLVATRGRQRRCQAGAG